MKLNLKSIFSPLMLSLAAMVSSPSAWAQQDSIPSTEEAQDFLYIPPLFDYVEVPDGLPDDLHTRADYLMDHFWDPFDFKKSGAVDQNALNHAFSVYVQAMPFASEKKVDESVKNLVKKIRNNPGLSLQFAKAAEETLYGPRAELWADFVYIEFLQNVVDNKKISDSRKRPFAERLALLRNATVGASFPEVNVLDIDGNAVVYRPSREMTLIEFTPPHCQDGPYSNLKLDISSVVNSLIEAGRLEVVLMVLDDKKPQGNFPDKWKIFYGADAGKGFDIKRQPSFFVVGKDGKVAGKNLPVDEAVDLVEALSQLK